MSRGAIWTRRLAAVILLLSPFSATAQDAKNAHPLDALTGDELGRVKSILIAEGKIGSRARFHSVDLDEPEKAEVLAWRPGTTLPRRAIAVVNEAGTVYEAAIDLLAGRITAWRPLTGEPALLLGEMMGAGDMAKADPRMVEALAKRGFAPDQVYCVPLTAGNFGAREEQGQRLLKVPCFAKPIQSNAWARPIEGLFATFDLKAGKAIDVIDAGVVPVPTEGWGYDEAEVAARGALRPETRAASLSQPGGDNIRTEDGRFGWDIWRFHLRADIRPGTVLSMVEVRDGARWRSVAYQMHLSEVFVPYMDPDQAWYWRTYMDSGEYGFGNLLSPLRPGVDCPSYARFLAVTMPQDNGEPMPIANAICLFERSIGDPAWRHFEIVGNTPQDPKPTVGRPASELVVRSASAIGNYDYLVDYVFRQDGSIRIAIGATGIDAVKGVASQSMKDATAAADTRWGTLIAPGLVAPFHSHYFNFRLDLDIDGTANDFMRERLVQQLMPEGLPRRSIFAVTHEMPASEQAARSRIEPASPALYHFGNHNVESALGHHPGYMLMPEGSYVHPLLAADDPPVRRNSYLHYQLSVTPRQPSERYAGGRFAMMSDGSDTLGAWTARDRPIGNRDIVAWYTVGFHHITRMEDWPVMPTHWFGFTLMPHNFFATNPAMTIREVK
ncbi:MAG: tyramine oxidase [Bradyrhizobium sp.]|nr:tyramine oxidase [Bradyrhizobium sp.]